MKAAVTAGHQPSPGNPELTEADDTLRITQGHKAASARNSPDVSVLQTTPGKVKRCRLRGLTQQKQQ